KPATGDIYASGTNIADKTTAPKELSGDLPITPVFAGPISAPTVKHLDPGPWDVLEVKDASDKILHFDGKGDTLKPATNDLIDQFNTAFKDGKLTSDPRW